MKEDENVGVSEQEVLNQLLFDGMRYSILAHESIFGNHKPSMSTIYLNCASSKMASAVALYYAKREVLDNNIEGIFQCFDKFVSEMMEIFEADNTATRSDKSYKELVDFYNKLKS